MTRMTGQQASRTVSHRFLNTRIAIASILIKICFLLASCLISISAQAEESPVFINAYTGPRSLDGSPNNDLGQTGSDSTTRLVDELLNEAGIEHAITVVPWSRAVQSARSEANVLVYSMMRTEQREDLYEWIGMIRPIETYIYSLNGELKNPPRSLDDIGELRIGLARFSAADELLRARGIGQLVYLADANRAPMLMGRGRIHLTPYTTREAASIVQQQNLAEDALVPLIRLDSLSVGTYIVVSKQTDPLVVRRLRQAYQRLVDDGRRASILGL